MPQKPGEEAGAPVRPADVRRATAALPAAVASVLPSHATTPLNTPHTEGFASPVAALLCRNSTADPTE